MDYKITSIKNSIIILFSSVVIYGCTSKEKMNTENTFYVDISNCPDSIKQPLMAGISGKTSYYKDNKLQIISLNYVTEDHPDMHYFKDIATISGQPKKGTNKILIQFAGNFTVDSTLYSIQEFKYNNGEWVKTSDIGFIKALPIRLRVKGTDMFDKKELSTQVIQTVVSGTY